MKEAVLNVETRSMRNNLVFYNIPEEEQEDCEDKLTNCIRHEMKIEVVSSDFARVHRMGAKRGGSIRPIVARFQSFKKKEVVRKAAPVLKGKRFGVSEQYPREIADKRK